MKKFFIVSALLSLLVMGFSCTKNYSVSPLPAPTATPAPNPLICTPTQTAGPPPNGIYWYSAQIEGITVSNGVTVVNGIFAQVLLTVNGTAETTDTVNVSGPAGLSATIPYTDNVVVNGNTYAQYQALLSNTYQTGGSYSLTTVTSIGTASATLTAPGNITVAPDGSSASWSNGGMLNTVGIYSSAPATVYQTATCKSESSPFAFPLSNYSQSAFYTFTVDCQNMTNAISGGAGYFKLYDNYELLMFKNEPPTATPIADTPTPTPVGTPFTDVFALSSNAFQPPASVSITASIPGLGYANLAVYSASGLFTQQILVEQVSQPVTGTGLIGTWNGTEGPGGSAPDGIYVVSFLEPDDWKLGLVLLIQ